MREDFLFKGTIDIFVKGFIILKNRFTSIVVSTDEPESENFNETLSYVTHFHFMKNLSSYEMRYYKWYKGIELNSKSNIR